MIRKSLLRGSCAAAYNEPHNLCACLLSLLFCLAGCGYQWGLDKETPSQIFIPFAKGDEDGTLTSEIIRSLTASGLKSAPFDLSAYQLNITVLNTNTQTIGYRRDKQKVDGKVATNIVACEGRKAVALEVSLIETLSKKILHGPCLISADADYDFIDGDSIQDLLFTSSAGVPVTVLPFSLGQLEPVEAAQEAASRPLNQKLSQKVVEYVLSVLLEKG